MRKTLQAIITTIILAGTVVPQSARPKFFDHARISHVGPSVVVTANDSLPLFQAVSALRLEYGWRINWESAPGYSQFDVADDTDPKWRASHPSAKGVTRPAGNVFSATLPEPTEASGIEGERLALARLIEQYNTSNNPGRYELRSDSSGQFTIVGIKVRDKTGGLVPAVPLLDTLVTIPKASRSVYDTVDLLLLALRGATGKEVIFAVASSSLFRINVAELGAENTPARDILTQALSATGQESQYALFFNPDVPAYVLNVSPVMKEEDDGSGGKRLVGTGR